MIPQEIRPEHIVEAIEKIRMEEIPPRRRSRKYYLKYEDGRYPPKFVVSVACKFATGRELSHKMFNGGFETNSFLEGLGFQVVDLAGRRVV